MSDEEKKAQEEAEEAQFLTEIEGLPDTEKAEKIAERKAQKEGAQETPEQKAARLLTEGGDKGKKILVDSDRFNDRNDKAKLYETFAPIIDKVKGDPELVARLLDTKNKGSLEDRVNQMEQERKDAKQGEIKAAVTAAIKRFKGFEKDWPEIRDQVEMLAKRGLPFEEAIRRSYLALHPEEAVAEATRIAAEVNNGQGAFRSGGGYAPHILDTKQEPKLNERERKVAHDLLGKDFGNGMVLIKSESDYAQLLEKHKDHLRAKGFFDLP